MDRLDKIITANINRFVNEETVVDNAPQPITDELFEMLKHECENHEVVIDYTSSDEAEADLPHFYLTYSYDTQYECYEDSFDHEFGTEYLGVTCEMTECNIYVNATVYEHETEKEYSLTDEQQQILNAILEKNAEQGSDYAEDCDYDSDWWEDDAYDRMRDW